MAITTLTGVGTGLQIPRTFNKGISATLVLNRHHTFWGLAGYPAAGAYNTTLNGVTLSSSSTIPVGAIPHVDPASGNAYLARFEANSTQPGQILLCDRLWHNGGYTITSATAQNSTTPTWPARDVSGSTNGDGVLLALEVSAAAGAAAPTITVSYTNSGGTAGRSGTNILATAASPAIGATYLIGLQAGDTGVRSVQSLTLSVSWVSGTINLVAYRVIASIETPFIGSSNAIDAITAGFPRIYDGTVPYLMFIPSTTTASFLSGTYIETQG